MNTNLALTGGKHSGKKVATISVITICLFCLEAKISAQVDGKAEGHRPLPQHAIQRLGSASLSHRTRISAVSFSPDEKYLASADSDGIVRLWDAGSGRLILEKANGGGRKLAFAPDGNTIAIGGYYNKQIILWDLKKNEYVGAIPQNARGLQFSKDGNILFAVGEDKIARAWNPKTKKLVREYKGHRAELYDVAVSPDGTMLATSGGYGGSSRNNEVRLWNVESGELLGILDDDFEYYEKLPDAVYNLNFSHDGKTLGTAGPYVTRIWDVDRKKVLERISKSTSDVAFSPTRDQFVACGKLGFFDLKTRQKQMEPKGLLGDFEVAEYSASGKLVATGNNLGLVQIWDAETGKEISFRKGHEGGVRSVAYTADGSMIASLSRQDSTLRLWGTRTGVELQTISLNWKGSDVWWNEEGSDVFCTPNGRNVMTWTHDATVKVWSLDTGDLHDIRLGRKTITALTFSPDGNRAAVREYEGSGESLIGVYELDGGKMIAYIDPFDGKRNSDAWVGSMAFSPDGRSLAIGALASSYSDDPAPSVQIWDLEKVELKQKVRDSVSPPGNLAYSNDGKWLASSSTRGSDLEVWNTATWKVERSFKVPADAHGRTQAPIAFSPDGKMMAAAHANHKIFVWETLTWQKVKVFEGHEKSVTSVQFSPDGKTLISSSEDATVLVWKIKESSTNRIVLSQQQLEAYWKELGSSDGDIANLAMISLSNSPTQAIGLCEKKMDVGQVLEMKQVPTLIQQVINDDPQVHLSASLKLREFGKQAAPQLFQALSKSKDNSASARLENLLATINKFPVSAKELRRKRAIQILEQIGNESAKKVLRQLAESETRSRACLDAEAALIRLIKLERLQK